MQGASIPWPYGGKQPQVQVDIDSAKLQAMHLSPADVVNAFSAQNLILPSGTEKIGRYEYQIETNSAPRTIEGLNDLPIKTVNGATILRPRCGPCAQWFSAADQHRAREWPARCPDDHREDWRRFDARSCCSMFAEFCRGSQSGLPPAIENPSSGRPVDLRPRRHQRRGGGSGNCRLSHRHHDPRLSGQLAEHADHRRLDPALRAGVADRPQRLGQTINIMTLGGLALAVGILVDDATVEIENINRNLEMGKEIEQAILDGAARNRYSGIRLHAFDLHRVCPDVFL